MLISYCILILVYPNYIILKILCLLTKVTSINKTKTGTMNKQQDFNPKNYDIYIDMKTPTYSVMLKNIELLDYLNQDSYNIFPNCLFLP